MNKAFFFFCISLLNCTLLISRETTIFQEVKERNKQAIKERIANCEDCSQKDENGKTALHIAAEEGDEEIVDMLTTPQTYWEWLCAGFYSPRLPDKDETDNEGNTPLHGAFKEGQEKTAEVLLKKEAKRTILNKKNLTPVFLAVEEDRADLVPFLVRYDLINQTINDKTILHFAIEHNKPAMVKHLSVIEALVNRENGQGETPVITAARCKNTALLYVLKQNKINLHVPNKAGKRAITQAAHDGDLATIKFLIEDNPACVDVTDNNGNTPLMYAAHNNKKDAVDFFLAYKSDVSKRNNLGNNAFTIAIRAKNYELARYLAQKPGVNINNRDTYGNTALNNAALEKDLQAIELLFSLGADSSISNNNGENPLHKVAQNGDSGIARLLLKHNKSLVLQGDKNGNTPLFVAIEYKNLTAIKELIGYATFKERNNKGETLFHQAAKVKDLSIIAEVYNKGNRHMSLDVQDNEGLTPLHTAAHYNNIIGMQELERRGAQWNMCTHAGNTLVHSAVLGNAPDAVEYIIKKDPALETSVNKSGYTPFLFSAKEGKTECTRVLLREAHFITGDVKKAIALSKDHLNQYNDLVKGHKNRRAECRKIVDEYYIIENLKQDKQAIVHQLQRRNALFALAHLVDYMNSPEYYSEEQLYHMPITEQQKILNIYVNYKNTLINDKIYLTNQLNDLLQQEEESKRIAAEQQYRAEQARIAHEQAELRSRNEALEAQKRRELELKQQKLEAELAQKRELDRYQEDKRKKDAEEKEKRDAIAAVELQKERERLAAAKAALEREQKQARALEGQHEYVQLDLKPSAPLMDEDIVSQKQCTKCDNKAIKNAIACKVCKQTMSELCAPCFNKKNKGRCEECLKNELVKPVQGKCCICLDNTEVRKVPCKENIKATEPTHVCKECLLEWIATGQKPLKDVNCPHCGARDTLLEDLIQKIKK